MGNKVTIITYHYVRPLADSRYPTLKGLDYDLFKKQIEFITKNYAVVNMEDILNYFRDQDIVKTTTKRARMFSFQASKKPLALLAFDDGYIDHYTYVFPILQQHGIQGSFFIPAKPIIEKTVLDVNKIHLILQKASTEDIIKHICGFIIENEFGTLSFDTYYNKYSENNRFDDADTMFVKRFLQKWDKAELRHQLVDELFKEFVREDEKIVSQELYMNVDQIRHMHRAGMYIGGHTYNHNHLGAQNEEDQDFEISRSYNFLVNHIGCNPHYSTLSYPYGSHNENTANILKEYGFELGIGIDYGIADLKTMDRFNVPRIDCNDITKMMLSA